METSSPKIQKQIEQAVETVVQQMLEQDDTRAEVLNAKSESHLVINSSFLYRNKRLIKTSQSSRRLVAKVVAKGKGHSVEEVSISDNVNLKGHCRVESSAEHLRTVTLAQAVLQELGLIGDVVFVLTGIVKGLRESNQPVNSKSVKTLRLSPALSKDVEKVADEVYALKNIIPIEDLLSQIVKNLPAGTVLSETDRQAIAQAYDELLDGATTDVAIPNWKGTTSKKTILGRIVESLQHQAEDYRTALKELKQDKNDRQALNEVLRIAYNFTTDVLPLIFLFTSICDLKPLVFWCTVDRQWALYRAFASLPWSALGRKERLEEYRDIVAAARNHAFHHVLSFDTTIEVDLSDVNVRAERMRLFPPHGQKQQGGVRLRDQELVDVFAEFSRAKQRPVSTLFWQQNVKVMEAAADLAKGMLDTLLLLHQSRPSRKRS